MSEITVNGSAIGTQLQSLLMCDAIVPGAETSYQIAKTIYLYHPLGGKMVDAPISMAQSQQRKISIPNSPEERVREQFEAEWSRIGADKHIANTRRMSRIYGIGSVIFGAVEKPTDQPIDPFEFPKIEMYFNVLDPLNTAGSLVLNQDPNSPDFQKHLAIRVAGQAYHRSRACVMLNEEPVYIAYTQSAFGYVGRSVYQRALFPLKSFVQSMITDDLVTRKAGVLVAKVKPAGSITDRSMLQMLGIKRNFVKEAENNNVISVAPEEDIASLDLQNLDGAAGYARKNVLENIAVSADMPAKMLNSETFAEGFGEGTEDAKNVARYIDRERVTMKPLYDFFDNIVMFRAWNEEFYATIQNEFPEEYGGVDYKTAFYRWKNSFAAEWPSLLTEPDSEKAKSEDVKLKAIIATMEVLLPTLDPENKARLIDWAASNMNANKMLFSDPLNLDMDAFREYVPPTASPEDAAGQEIEAPKPFAAAA